MPDNTAPSLEYDPMAWVESLLRPIYTGVGGAGHVRWRDDEVQVPATEHTAPPEDETTPDGLDRWWSHRKWEAEREISRVRRRRASWSHQRVLEHLDGWCSLDGIAGVETLHEDPVECFLTWRIADVLASTVGEGFLIPASGAELCGHLKAWELSHEPILTPMYPLGMAREVSAHDVRVRCGMKVTSTAWRSVERRTPLQVAHFAARRTVRDAEREFRNNYGRD
jgi:hypothetical protein